MSLHFLLRMLRFTTAKRSKCVVKTAEQENALFSIDDYTQNIGFITIYTTAANYTKPLYFEVCSLYVILSLEEYCNMYYTMM